MAFVSGQQVADYLGRGDDAALVDLAWEHLDVVEQFVKAYTRGRGFLEGQPVDAVAAVILSATARLTNNPQMTARESVGSFSQTPAVLDGWTLPELAVLHRYRVRAA